MEGLKSTLKCITKFRSPDYDVIDFQKFAHFHLGIANFFVSENEIRSVRKIISEPGYYVMEPAIVYNGNRYQSIGNGYNPHYSKEMYHNPKVPLTISNNPRLVIEQGKASVVELQTGNAATPAMCFYSPADWQTIRHI